MKKPNGFQENPTKPKKPDTDKDTDTETDKEKDTDKDISKKKKEKRKTFEDVFEENNFDEELEATLKDFIDMRKTMQKPMTTKALELLIRNLKKLTNLKEEQVAILNQSIEHGWQTVYPLKNDFKQKTEKKTSFSNYDQREYDNLNQFYANKGEK